eukprot:m.516564 g.516564  ORF g.516564 m.516564 type:complete len:884 (+) comp21929_c0_seq8:155-2806(+)
MAFSNFVLSTLSAAVSIALSVSSSHGLSPPVVSWVSNPVQPGQVLLLQGCCFSNTTSVSIVAGDGQHAKVTPVQISTNSLKVIVPSTFPNGSAYNISVIDAHADTTTTSEASVVNAPDPWWIQGDQGATASPGGWLRVVGNCLSLPKSVTADHQQPSDSMWAAAQTAVQSRNLSALIQAQQILSMMLGADGEERNWHTRTTPTIRLTLRSRIVGAIQKESKEPITISAVAENVTLTSAHFLLPASLASGEWLVEISNGAIGVGYIPLDSFVSPSEPHVDSITVQQPRAIPPEVFKVSAYGNHSLPCNLRDSSGACKTADAAVQAALAAAKVNGGGTVYFESGTFYLSQPLEVSPNVILKGESMATTAIYFAEDTPASAPVLPYAYFYLEGVANWTSSGIRGNWGIEDMTIFVTAYHNYVVHVDNRTDGFHMQRVRTRVNAWVFSDGPNTTHDGRWQNYSWPGLNYNTFDHEGAPSYAGSSQNSLIMLNGKNFEITDCDLFADVDVLQFYSPGYPGVGHIHGAQYGYIARNRIWNGGSSHFMNQWQQVLFEHNDVTGVSLMSGGQSFGTGPWGGFCHNVHSAGNNIQFTWSNDREVMTFDDAGGSYYGPVASVQGTTLLTAQDCKAPASMEWGGWAGGVIVVLSGDGLGQSRRIVVAGPYGPGVTGAQTRKWIVEKPFTIPPKAGDIIEIMPFRGKSVWEGNQFTDTGPFQFYGHATDIMVVKNTFTRHDVVAMDGQWRGWQPATALDKDIGHGSERLRGVANNGMQPNLHIQLLENVVAEGNNIFPFNKSGGGGPYPTRTGNYVIVSSGCESEGKNCPSNNNLFCVIRSNRLDSNAGISVGQSNRDIVVDQNSIAAWPASATSPILVDARSEFVYVHNNTISA